MANYKKREETKELILKALANNGGMVRTFCKLAYMINQTQGGGLSNAINELIVEGKVMVEREGRQDKIILLEDSAITQTVVVQSISVDNPIVTKAKTSQKVIQLADYKQLEQKHNELLQEFVELSTLYKVAVTELGNLSLFQKDILALAERLKKVN